MIHISQEELLKKIEQDHKHLLFTREEQEKQMDYELVNQREMVNKGKLQSFATGKETDRFASRTQTTRRATEEKSSLFPTTCASLTDRNNNSIPNDKEDETKAVLITGCGSKIGREIAVAFAQKGVNIALVDFNTQQTDSVAIECQQESPKQRIPLQIVADISQLDAAHKVIDRTIEEFGRLDVLVNTVNNASLMEAKFNGSGDDDPHVFEQYHKIIANNMHSVTYLCISAAPYLRKTKGYIVNVSSITNNETGSYKFAYCMSKAGISTLTKCLATDLAPDIKVICVSPKSDHQ